MSDTQAGAGAQGAAGTGANGQGTTAQGAAQGTGNEGNNGTGAQGAANGGAGGQGPKETPEQLAAKVAEREAENATYREKIRTLEAAEAKRQQDAMTEEQRKEAEQKALQQERDELAAKLADRDDRDTIKDAAGTLGFKNPTLAAGLVTLSDVRGADGKLDEAKVKAKLQAVLTADPYLGTTGNGDGGGGRGGGEGRTGDMNNLIRGGRG